MPDWTANEPPAPPGALTPDPTPFSPGWSDWMDKELQQLRQKHPEIPATGYSTSLVVERRGTKIFLLSGGQPGQWEKEDKTYVTQPPTPYRDFTRFRRKFPQLVWGVYREIKVDILVEWVDAKGHRVVIAKGYFFWVLEQRFTRQQVFVYRWKLTSGERPEPGLDGSVGWTDESPPPGDPQPKPGDSPDPLPSPPPEVLRSALASPARWQSGWFRINPHALRDDLRWRRAGAPAQAPERK